MEYWKLLDLLTHEYTTHETEEEVNHMIEHLTRDMDGDKIIRRVNIKTPFANYDFQHIIVYNPQIVRHFIYFFDSIEEQCDTFEEELHEKEETICEQQERLSKTMLNNFYGVTREDILEAGLDECEKTNEFLRKEIRRLENEVGRLRNIVNNSAKSEYWKEVLKSKEHRIDVLEEEKQKLVRECTEIEKALAQRDKMLEQIRDIIYPF